MNYKTPGVYVEEIPLLPPSIAAVETAIPAFIGYTEKAVTPDGESLLAKPTRITSMIEYVLLFGEAKKEVDLQATLTQWQDADGNVIRETLSTGFELDGGLPKRSKHNMYYSLQAFFANGGGPCYIVSIGAYGEAIQYEVKDGDDNLTGGLHFGLKALAKEDEPTIIVFPEAQNMAANFADIYSQALSQCEDLGDRVALIDVNHTGEGLQNNPLGFNNLLSAFRDLTIGSTLEQRRYGASYFPNLETTLDYQYEDADVTIIHKVYAANATDPSDGALNGNNLGELKPIDSNTGADARVYALVQQSLTQLPVVLPPSPIMAGVYAYVDNTRGVWKAPANVSVNAVAKPTYKVTDEEQSRMNVHPTAKSINAIRTFKGKGTLVWGARTLDGNSNEWRYVPVRRFFNFAEESIKKGTEPFVFEPNDRNTWTRVRGMIENFLTLQWNAGALQGATPEDAFFVKVGLPETMTALDILEGRMNVEIGMAVVRPAEFIILKFSHKLPES